MIEIFQRTLLITEQVSVQASIEALAEALREAHGASEAFVGSPAPRFSLGKSAPEKGTYVLVSGSMGRSIQLIDPTDTEPETLEAGRFLVLITERWLDALTQVDHLSNALREASSQDTLTGVLNRRSFMAFAVQRLEAAQAEGRSLAVLMLDVRGFSKINSLLGDELGDELLFEVASKVRLQIREQDLVARLERDQFMILLDQIPSPESAERVAIRVLSCLECMPIEHWQGIRLGVAVSPSAGRTVMDLTESAAAALKEAKTLGLASAYRGL
jgi:diguanylate cyclase (GGDEF)-like protein